MSDVEIHLRAYDEASSVIEQVGNTLSVTFTDIEGKTQALVDTTDQATSQIASDYDKAAAASSTLGDAQDATNMSAGNAMMSMNSLAMSAAALGISFMNVENAQVRVDRANLMVERSTATLEAAQTKYNDAVVKYGANSTQAQDALQKLQIAQDAHSVVVERADMAARSYNTTLLMVALTVIPSVVSIIGVVSKATEIWTGIQKTLNDVIGSISLSPLTMGIGLVIAGVAALAIGIGTWIGSMSAAADEERKFNDMLAESNRLANINAATWAQVSQAIIDLTNNMKTLTDKQTQLNKSIEDANNFQEAGNKILGALAGSQQAFNDKVNAGVTALEDKKKKTDDAIASDQKQLDLLSESTKVQDMFTSNFVTNSAKYTAAVNSMADNFIKQFGGMADLSVESANTERDAIQKLVDQYGVSWDTMYNAVKDSVNKQLTAIQTEKDSEEKLLKSHLDSVKTEFFDKYVANSAQFVDDVKWHAEEINQVYSTFGDNTDTCSKYVNGIIQSFADQWGITWDEAKTKLFDEVDAINSKIPEVADTVDTELVGRAQNNLKTFQDCATGKFTNIKDDNTANIQTLVNDTNDLISRGLVGQAQDNIKAFVDCSTSKQQKMVEDISGYLDTLQNEYDTNLKKIADATAKGKDDEVAIWTAKNDEIKSKMDQLQSWQDVIIAEMEGKIVAATDSVATNVTGSLGKADTAVGNFSNDMKTTLPPAVEGSTNQSGVSMTNWAQVMIIMTSMATSYVHAFVRSSMYEFDSLNVEVGAVDRVFYSLASAINGALNASEWSMRAWYSTLVAYLNAGIAAIAAFNARVCFAHGLAEAVEASKVTMDTWNTMLQEKLDKGLSAIRNFNAGASLEGVAGGVSAGAGVPSAAVAKASVTQNFNFNEALVKVEGSVDKKTADLVVKQVMDSLKTVIVEATSGAAPATQKRIRQGAVFT